MRIRVLGLGRRGGRGQGRWEWEIPHGIPDVVVGIVLVGPSRDQRPQGGIGSEDAVVAVAMNPGWGKDGGETIQKLEGREAERGAAREIRSREDGEHLVGAATDEVKPLESEGGPGTVADQALEAGSVMALDTDAGVEAKTTAVIPAEHILGFVGFEEAMATKMAEDSFAYRVLEALQELGRESGGFVEAEVVGRVGGIRFRIDPLKESIDDGQVEVEMGIETGAEAVQEAHSAHGGGSWSRGTGLPQGGMEGPQQDVEDGTGGPRAVVEEGPEAFRHGEHELAHRHVGRPTHGARWRSACRGILSWPPGHSRG